MRAVPARDVDPPQHTGERILIWNGSPLTILSEPARASFIVRTRRLSRAEVVQYRREGFPDSVVLMREHAIEVVTEDVTLAIRTNAPEAAVELPDEVRTSYRDTGTFYDAAVVFRGREDRAFVSVRPTEPRVAAALAGVKDGDAVAALSGLARQAFRSGLVVGGGELVKGWRPEDVELANLLLMYRDASRQVVYSYAEIGAVLGVTAETVRARREALEAEHPGVRRIIAAVRARNEKGGKVLPMGARAAVEDEDGEEGDES